jgi:hypothetical protein
VLAGTTFRLRSSRGDRPALLRGDVPAALVAQIAHLEVGWRQAAPSDILVARY